LLDAEKSTAWARAALCFIHYTYNLILAVEDRRWAPEKMLNDDGWLE
jgi:hypothetical protein